MPRGGRRAGSGRKPKTALEKALGGNAGHRARVLPGPGAGQVPVTAPIAPVAVPAVVTMDADQVWAELSPFALAARTLTPATALAFRVLCRNVALEQMLAAGPEKGGANHRGMIQRIDAELGAFNLRPFGKPIYEAEVEAKPANPLAEFLKRG